MRETIVDLELCSGCAFRCNFCPRAQVRRAGRLMSPEVVRRVAALLDGSKVAWFSGMGEPFLNPALPEAVRILRASGARVYSNTNASPHSFVAALREAMAAGLSFLNVSAYGWDRESYVLTTGQDKFDAVRENVWEAWRMGIPMRLSHVTSAPPSSDDALKARLGEAFGVERVRLLRAHGRASAPDRQPPPACGLALNYLFVTCDGVALPCVNDVGAAHPLPGAEEAWEAKKAGYPFAICRKCDAGGRFASLQDGYLEKVRRLGDG